MRIASGAIVLMLVWAVTSSAQTEIGPSVDAGGIGIHTESGMSEQRRLTLQLRDFDKYNAKIQPVLGVPAETVKKSYRELRMEGYDISPIEYLSLRKIVKDKSTESRSLTPSLLSRIPATDQDKDAAVIRIILRQNYDPAKAVLYLIPEAAAGLDVNTLIAPKTNTPATRSMAKNLIKEAERSFR